MQRRLKLPYFKILFEAYKVERKVITFDGRHKYFSSVFQTYKLEVKIFRVLRYIMTFFESDCVIFLKISFLDGVDISYQRMLKYLFDNVLQL